jgi:trigger factor
LALIEGCKHSLELEVPPEALAAEVEKAAGKIRAKAHLKGFRPGKAPLSLIRTQYSAEIRNEALDELVPRYLQAACERENLHVVSRPDVKVTLFSDEEGVKLTATFEVTPEFELHEARGLGVEYAEPGVSDADIDAKLEEMRQQRAEYINQDPRPAADGDHVLVDMESVAGLDGPALRQADMNIEVGHQDTFTALSDALRGASPGDVAEAEVEYPENYASERLAGKTVRFRLSVKTIRLKEVPELDDEFAKSVGDFQSLDELREEVRKAIFHEREYLAQTEAKNKLVDQLVDLHDFAVPEIFVEEQMDAILENRLRLLASQGVDVSKLKLDWAELRRGQRDRAIREVKASLLLDKLAERESLFVTQEEVDREVQRAARQSREPVAAVRMRLEKDGGLRRIASRIRTDKTLSFLFEHARKEAPAPAAE